MQKRSVDVAVISDVHLGTYGSRATELLMYLRSISPQMLILNGDIIDGWQFSKHYFPSSHVAVLNEIMYFLSSGVRVLYITGNHDEMLRKYSDLELGNFRLADKAVIEVNGKSTWIFHGDAFDNTTKGGAKFWAKLGSNGYAILLGFNKLLNRAARLLGKQPLSFSRRIMQQVNKSLVKVEQFETLVSELAIEKKYHYVICGHTHQPKEKRVQTTAGSVTYLNGGDWVEHMTALEYYDKDWHIHYHRPSAEETRNTEKKYNNDIRVMTDEVLFYLHSL